MNKYEAFGRQVAERMDGVEWGSETFNSIADSAAELDIKLREPDEECKQCKLPAEECECIFHRVTGWDGKPQEPKPE